MNTALKESLTDAKGCASGTMAGWTRTPSDPSVAGLDDGEQLDDETEPLGRFDVLPADVGDALPVNVARHHLGPEGHVGQDRRLGGGIVTLDVGRRVALGEAEALSLGQGLLVGGARSGHAGEDVVGRPVDDAHHPVDALARQRLSQRPDERYATGDGRLEQKIDPCGTGGVP